MKQSGEGERRSEGVGWPQINAGPEETALRPIRLHLTGTSSLSKGHSGFCLGVCSGGSGTRPFHAAGAASIRMALRDEGYTISSQCLSPLRRLHGGGCQRKAKQIRSRNDAPVFPIDGPDRQPCVCVYTRATGRSCRAQLLRPLGGSNWLK